MLTNVGRGEPPGWAASSVHQVEPGQGRERELAAVGRRAGPLDVPNDDRVGIGRVVESGEWAQRLVDVRRERDRRRPARADLDPHDLAAVTRDQGLAVRSERRARREIARRRAFLIIALSVLDEPALVAGLEIPEAERARAALSGGV